jgi:thiosulfate/3-mercaptopyruvate sulfurtransferase
VLDARDDASFRQAHINGARQISISNLSAVIHDTGKNRPIVIYCYHGYASREYAQVFSDFGFTEVYSVDGGYKAWSEQTYPMERAKLDAGVRRWLTEQGFQHDDINAVVANDTTPLMRASHKGDIDMVGLLIQAGARLNARNADGNNALWLACVGGHPDIIDVLTKAGIEIDNQNDNGATPLMYAASAGKAEIVDSLLARGASTDVETLDGFTPLDLASTAECLALIRRASGPGRSAGVRAEILATTSPNL